MPASTDNMPHIKDFRPFVMCGPDNYEATKSFYSELGFKKRWDDGGSACEYATGFGEQRFLVTLHYGLDLSTNPMLHFWVDDAQAWYDYMTDLELEKRYPGVVITPPVVTEWGWLITYVADPCGQKLHFAEPHSEQNKAFFNGAGWMNRSAE